jgi:hypothetical protein
MATTTDDTQFIPLGNKEHQQEKHRALNFSVKHGRQFTFFKINDSQYGCNNIPFGWVDTHPKGTHPQEYNVIIPVIPLRYTDNKFDKQSARAGYTPSVTADCGESRKSLKAVTLLMFIL